MNDKEEKNVIRGALNIRKENMSIHDMEKFKQNQKAAGIFMYASSKSQEMHSDAVSILVELKERKAYLDEGYANFGDYAEAELKISQAKATELTKQIKSLGEPTYETLDKMGFGYRAKRALRQGQEQNRVETDDSGKSIEIDGETIDLIPENKDRIKELIKKIEKDKADLKKAADDEAKLRIEIQEKLEKKTTIRDVSFEEYNIQCNALELEFTTLFDKLENLYKQGKLSPQKEDLFIKLMHVLNKRFLNAFEYYVHGIVPAEIIED